MVAEVKSKNELLAIAGKLKTVSNQFTSEAADIISNLSEAEDYDGIPISQAAMSIQNNLKNISGEMESLTLSINNYAASINNIDTYNLQSDVQAQTNSNQNNAGASSPINDASLGTNPVQLNAGSNGNANSSGSNASPRTNPAQVNAGSSGNANSSGSNASPRTNPSRVNAGSSGNAGSFVNGALLGTGAYLHGSGNGNSGGGANTTQEIVSGSNKELKAEGKIEITQGDPNYDLNGRNHQYVESIFQMTSGNLAYKISDNDFDLLCAIVSAESNKSYDGSLAVASTILNRCEHPSYVALYGVDPIAQATANNQFSGYLDSGYKQYINGGYPDSVKQAVIDALAGVRNHKICNFSKDNMISL